jgi:hypothetical protein
MTNVTFVPGRRGRREARGLGPLDEATGGPMHTSGTTIWTGTWQIRETIRKLYVLF